MSNIPLMFQLPNAWLVAFLSEWLDMPDIGKLDIAISSNEHRPQFLLNLQSMRSTSVDSFSDGRGRKLGYDANGGWTGWWWRWLSIRQIYIESVLLRGMDVRSDLIIPSMQKVVVDSFAVDDFQYLVRNCPALRSLCLHGYVTNIGLRIVTNLHQSLEEFSFSNFSLNDQTEAFFLRRAAALIDILRQCSRLQKVSLTGRSLRFVDVKQLVPYGHLFHELGLTIKDRIIADGQAISNFLTNCGNLRKLRFVGSVEDEETPLVLTAIFQYCLLLEEVVFWNLSLVSLGTGIASLSGDIANICKNWHFVGASYQHLVSILSLAWRH